MGGGGGDGGGEKSSVTFLNYFDNLTEPEKGNSNPLRGDYSYSQSLSRVTA